MPETSMGPTSYSLLFAPVDASLLDLWIPFEEVLGLSVQVALKREEEGLVNVGPKVVVRVELVDILGPGL